MKKWGMGLAGFILGLVIMIGIGITLQNKQAQQATTNSIAASKADQTANTGTRTNSQNTVAATKKSNAIWNDTKAQKLANFMAEWGDVMDQNYDASTPSHGVSFYGLQFPQDLNNILFKVNDTKASIAWSTTGNGHQDYELVAVYTDAQHAESMDAHLYFFTLHQGTPVTLITEQTNGDVKNDGLYFKPTANKALSNGFATIVNGGTPHM